MTKKQHYMTWEERCQLEALLGEKVPVAKIAKRLGFCRQTIYDEIKRRTYIHTCAYWDEERYSAEKGQQIHNRNQTAKGKPLKIGNDRKFADFLEKKMLGAQAAPSMSQIRRRCPPPVRTRRRGFPCWISTGRPKRRQTGSRTC